MSWAAASAALSAAVLAAAQESDEGWKFLSAYPPQYDAQRLAKGETIIIDGKLDDAAWAAVPWTEKPFEDIAAPLFPHLAPPAAYQTRLKVRWDEAYLYIGAELNEPVVWGNVTGHNDKLTHGKAPWWNNDFEVFVDVSGTTHYYKEYEMNARNATYDVLWRVPDQGMRSVGVPCKAHDPTLWCQNSTFNAGQKWTMYPGMQTGVDTPGSLTPFRSGWTAEIRFPIAARDGHGGLIDADKEHDFSRFDPNNGARYWWVDFARAEHPLETIAADPLGIDFFTKEYAETCKKVQEQYPSLLGTDAWGCYWEFVWNNLGTTQYMHNPEMWGQVHFVNASAKATAGQPPCRNPEWPARHVAQQLYRAQVASYKQLGRYGGTVEDLLTSKLCSFDNNCDLAALSDALLPSGKYSAFYTARVAVGGGSACVDYKTFRATGAPCFNITVSAGDAHQQATAIVRQDRYTTASSTGSVCL